MKTQARHEGQGGVNKNESYVAQLDCVSTREIGNLF
jgi:hypothetical protein